MARFERELSVEDYLEDELNRETRAVGLNVLIQVVPPTPVDTGRAKGNWQVEIDSRNFAETDTLDKSKGGGPTIARGSEVVGTGRLKKYFKIFIFNNLPYIGRLNAGSSEQTPAMWVESGIARVLGRRNLNG